MRRISVYVYGALAVVLLGAAPAAAQDWFDDLDDLADAIERQVDAIADQIEHAVEHHVDHLDRRIEHLIDHNVKIAIKAGQAQLVLAQRQAGEAARRAAQAAREAERRRRQEARRGPEYTDKLSRTLRLGRNGTFDLWNLSGDIVVTGGSGNDVRIDAIKRVRHPNESEARALLRAIDIRIEERNGNVEVRTDFPRRNWSGGVDYTISVPRDANVVLRSISGDIRVSSLNGELRAETTSGDLLATAVGRIRQAKSISGDVEIADSDGDEVSANTTSGSLIVRGVKARNVDLQSVSGDLRLTDVESERMFVRSVSGNVEFGGRLSRQGRYELQSHSGDVRVSPLGSQGFSLEASTFSGDLRSDYPLTLQGNQQNARQFRRTGRGIRGSFGEGGAVLTLQSFSGNITIVKR
jgi:DUF4097 and DUF4098 domain-containing protein YvlB